MTRVDGVIAAPANLHSVAEEIRLRLASYDELRLLIRSLPGADAFGSGTVAVIVPIVASDSLPVVLAMIAQARERRPNVAIIAVCQKLSSQQLFSLLAAGVSDLVTMPVCDEELLARFRRAIFTGVAATPSTSLTRLEACFGNLIGTSSVFVKQTLRLPVLASCDASVLILGETGTGKEVCAQAIHYLSARASRPWIAVNCGAIPIDLLENELFGHARGAYTTAHTAHGGLVREAEGGTLFLDEVDCLATSAQVKLLRFLQDKEYRPVGESRAVKANVRVIAASNRDVVELVSQGTFRQDLFFRLNVLALYMPALRERLEDIPALVEHFVQQFAAQYQRSVTGLASGALQILLAYRWPGNVRELKHIIERAVLLTSGTILSPDDIELPGDHAAARDESFRQAKSRVIDQFEKNYLESLLATHEGNITRAAHAAKKNRRALFHLLRKHGVSAERFRHD